MTKYRKEGTKGAQKAAGNTCPGLLAAAGALGSTLGTEWPVNQNHKRPAGPQHRPASPAGPRTPPGGGGGGGEEKGVRGCAVNPEPAVDCVSRNAGWPGFVCEPAGGHRSVRVVLPGSGAKWRADRNQQVRAP